MKKLLTSKLTFICFKDLFEIVSRRSITGAMVISWKNSSNQIAEWVRDKRISSVAQSASSGKIFVSDGLICGASIDHKYDFAEDEEFNTLLQTTFGVGCGVLPDTEVRIYEGENGQSFNDFTQSDPWALSMYLYELGNDVVDELFRLPTGAYQMGSQAT